MNIPEYKTTTIEKQRFILSHYGVGKSCWDWLILVVSFYVAIVVPYNATFKDKQEDLMGGECKIDSIDILVELVFLIDVLLNFRTTFVNRKGEVVTRPEIICKHYVRGWFVVDACAALPFDLLCSLNLYSRSRLDLNLLKLIRLLRLARLLQKMDRYSQYSYIILTLLMLIFSLLAHWCACIWYVIAMEEIAQNPSDWKIGWLHQLSDKLGRNVVNATDMAASYVTALYFTTSSLTSVGFGNVSANTNAEKIFSIVIMLIGALMHAVVFGNVTALIRVMYARRSNYQTRLRDLKDFFRLHQLPKELQQRMSDYFQTTWSLNHGIETYEILKDFPEELRGDVSLHLHREVLSLPIFETAPQGFLKSLARHIESKFCCPTEYLIHRGDALNYLYLVCNGSMEVLQDNMVVAILGKGDLVGNDVNAVSLTPTNSHGQFVAAGLNHNSHQMSGAGLKQAQLPAGSLMTSAGKLVKSSSDLKALTYCDLKCIQIAGLLEVLKLYPEFSDTFQREIIHDLSFNLRENHDIDHESMMMGAGNEDEEDEDEDEDEEEDEDEGGAAGGEDADEDGEDDQQQPPSSRRGSTGMNHLFRSINEQQRRQPSNQIGRYDYDLDEDVRRVDDEELILDEQEEEEEDEEEDEDEDEDDDEDGALQDFGARNKDDDRGDDSDDNGRAPGFGGRAAPPPQSGEQEHSRQTNGGRQHQAEENGRQDSGRIRQTADEELARGGKMTTEVASHPRRQQSSLRRRRMRRPADNNGDDDDDEDEDDGAGRTTTETGSAAADRVSWHSCEGLSSQSCADSPRSLQFIESGGEARQATAKSMMMGERNTGDESPSSGYRTGGNNNNNGHRQQSALKLSDSGGKSAGTLRDRKPPIMFDLSRNTTVIVDRRRRSAGSIMAPRPLLIGRPAAAGGAAAPSLQGAGGRRQAPTSCSSLTHISENPAAALESASGPTRSGRIQQRNSPSSSISGKASSQRQRRMEGPEGSYSSQDFKGLDARLNCLSGGVRELKQEMQQELSQMRGTMQLLVRIVEQQQRRSSQWSGSLGQIPTTDGPGRPSRLSAAGAASTKSGLSWSSSPRAARANLVINMVSPPLGVSELHTGSGGVNRSKSASSLPAKSGAAGQSIATGSSRRRRAAAILREVSDVELDLGSCDAEIQSVASEPAALSLPIQGTDQRQMMAPPDSRQAPVPSATPTHVIPAQVCITGARAVSQCSARAVSPSLPASPPAPSSSASQLQPTGSLQLHSDNDSGRSSTSMNSSSQPPAVGPKHVMLVQSQPTPSYQPMLNHLNSTTATTLSPESALNQPDQQPDRGAKLARVVVFAGGQRQQQHSTAVTTANHDQNGPNHQCNASKSSIV